MRIITVLLCMTVCAPTMAHRQHHVWTEIHRSESTHSIEVSHRIHLSDAITILQQAPVGVAQLPIESVEALAHVALYVDRHFSLRAACPGTEVRQIDLVGAGLDDDFVYVYQEVTLKGQLHELVFSNTMLHDLEPYAVGFVNVSGPMGQFTYQFARDSAQRQPETIHCVQAISPAAL
jgi:hypothetical protein